MGKTPRTGRSFRATAALIAAAVGFGCGPSETADSVVATEAHSTPAFDSALPETGKLLVEYSDGRVTVRSDGSLQLSILEQLAAKANFEIIAGKVDAHPITLRIENAALLDAIELILDGLTYTVAYDLDKASGTRTLARIEIGDAFGRGTANPAQTAASAALGTRHRVAGARSDQMERNSEEYSAEQAEILAELDSPDPEERADAVFWLDLDEQSLERMISLLRSDPDPDVRASIVDRLGDEESVSAISAVAAALQDPNPEVVLRAIEALQFNAEEWLIPELERLLTHSNPEVREAAEDAIEYLE
jgi:hypothetical protein